jgi:hypothetical protein
VWIAVLSCVATSLTSGGKTRSKIGSTDTASPTVTPIAANVSPSFAIPHNEPNTVAPKHQGEREPQTRIGPMLLRAVALDSKKRTCHSNAAATASSIAMTDWKYRTGTSARG